MRHLLLPEQVLILSSPLHPPTGPQEHHIKFPCVLQNLACFDATCQKETDRVLLLKSQRTCSLYHSLEMY